MKRSSDYRVPTTIGLLACLAVGVASGWRVLQVNSRTASPSPAALVLSPPDPSLVRLREQAGEVLTGRPSRLARQMPGASAELVAWLERWEADLASGSGRLGERSDSFWDQQARQELLALIGGSDLTTWDLTRLCRSMMVLDGRVEAGVVWVEPITSAAERDLALLKDDPAGREALAEQVHRAAGQAVWHCRDGAIQERLFHLLTENLSERHEGSGWAILGIAMAMQHQNRHQQSLHRLAEIEAAFQAGELSLSKNQAAELEFLKGVAWLALEDYDQATTSLVRAARVRGYHHGRDAVALLRSSLIASGAVSNMDELERWMQRYVELSKE